GRLARGALFPYTTLFRSWAGQTNTGVKHMNAGPPETVRESEAFRSASRREIGDDRTVQNSDRAQEIMRRLRTQTQRMPESRPSRSEEHTSELQSRENLVC